MKWFQFLFQAHSLPKCLEARIVTEAWSQESQFRDEKHVRVPFLEPFLKQLDRPVDVTNTD